MKIKQQDLLCDGKNISDSIGYVTRVYEQIMFPSTSQLAHIR